MNECKALLFTFFTNDLFLKVFKALFVGEEALIEITIKWA